MTASLTSPIFLALLGCSSRGNQEPEPTPDSDTGSGRHECFAKDAAATVPDACDEVELRDFDIYTLDSAALRTVIPAPFGPVSLMLVPDIGGGVAPDLVVSAHYSDNNLIYAWDAHIGSSMRAGDAWLQSEWEATDYHSPTVALAPGFYDTNAIIVADGNESPLSWHVFKSPLHAEARAPDADLIMRGRVDGREHAADSGSANPAGDLDGDGYDDILVTARNAGRTTWGGYYDVAVGRAYVVPGNTKGVYSIPPQDLRGSRECHEAPSWA